MYPPPPPSNEDKIAEKNEEDVNNYPGFEYIEEIQPDPVPRPKYKTSEHKSHEA